MNSTRNRDLLRESPAALARANRVAADTARHDPYWTPEQREERARYYEAQAERYEAAA